MAVFTWHVGPPVLFQQLNSKQILGRVPNGGFKSWSGSFKTLSLLMFFFVGVCVFFFLFFFFFLLISGSTLSSDSFPFSLPLASSSFLSFSSYYLCVKKTSHGKLGDLCYTQRSTEGSLSFQIFVNLLQENTVIVGLNTFRANYSAVSGSIFWYCSIK